MRTHCEHLYARAIEHGAQRAAAVGIETELRAVVGSHARIGSLSRRGRVATVAVVVAGHRAVASTDQFDETSLERAVEQCISTASLSARLLGERLDDGSGLLPPLDDGIEAESSLLPFDLPGRDDIASVLRRIESRDGISFGEVRAFARQRSRVVVDGAGTRAGTDTAAALRLRAAASRDHAYHVRSGFGGGLGRISTIDAPWADLALVEDEANRIGEHAVVLTGAPSAPPGLANVAIEPSMAAFMLLALARGNFAFDRNRAAPDLLSVAVTSARNAAIEASSQFVAQQGDTMIVRAGVRVLDQPAPGALLWLAASGDAPLATASLAVFGLSGATALADGSVEMVTELAWTVVDGRLDVPMRGVRLRFDPDWVYRIIAAIDTGPSALFGLPAAGNTIFDADFRMVRAPAIVVRDVAWTPHLGRIA